MDEDETRAEVPAAGSTGDGRDGFVRDRTHRFPGRRNALKVLYDDLEVASVRAAALLAGLTATGQCWRSCCGPGRRWVTSG